MHEFVEIAKRTNATKQERVFILDMLGGMCSSNLTDRMLDVLGKTRVLPRWREYGSAREATAIDRGSVRVDAWNALTVLKVI